MSVTVVVVPRRSWRALECFEFGEYDPVAVEACRAYADEIGAECHLTLLSEDAVPGWAWDHLPRRGLRRWWVRWVWNRMTKEESR